MSWESQLKNYDDLVDMCPRFERKGKTVPYTSANGHMFSFINKEAQFGIRLSKDDAAEFLKKNKKSGPFYSHGATMKDYVLVPDSNFKDLKALAKWLNKSYDYVMSLKPK